MADPKNVLYTVNTGRNLALSDDRDEIVPGTVVRVLWQYGSFTSGSMSVHYGGASPLTLAVNTAAEFVFYDSGCSGEWLITQYNVLTKA